MRSAGRTLASLGLALLLVPGAPRPAAARGRQAADAPAPAPALLRVFLDCNECDSEFMRQNVGFVDYVRDRAVADVHVLVTTEDTGGGGWAWTVRNIGLARFQGQDRTLTFTTPQTATDDDRRREFARVFRLGIVGYASDSSVASELNVTWTPKQASTTAAPTVDPWRNWVFRADTGGNFNGEQRSGNRSLRASFSASRTTAAWKINVSAGRNTNRSRFELDDGTEIISKRHSWNLNALVVKSLGNKWSMALRSGASHSSFSNLDRLVFVSPGIEFDVFPYAESSVRSLTFQYSAGAAHYDYRDVTIYDKLSDVVPAHGLNVSLGLRQPWGSLGATANLTQHFNHLDRWRAGIFAQADVRLFNGFSFNMFGDYAKINDQIGLPKGSASTEDILLSIRQLQTGYSYYFGFGVSYSFGSIFNTIVNPRFGSGGRIFPS
jgi:hypothetical protein